MVLERERKIEIKGQGREKFIIKERDGIKEWNRTVKGKEGRKGKWRREKISHRV